MQSSPGDRPGSHPDTGHISGVVTGGCLCGAVRYEYHGEIGPANYCHCADCRRCTGSAFNIGVRVEVEQLSIVRGTPRAFTKTGDSGNALTRHFCPQCGSSVLWTSSALPDHVAVAVGCFADETFPPPTMVAWTAEQHAWVRFPEGCRSFSGSAFAKPPEAAAN